jgi:hypothetical protein
MRIAATAGTSGCCNADSPSSGAAGNLDHDVRLSEAEGGSLLLPAQPEVSVLDRDAAATRKGCRPSSMAAVMSWAR